MNHEKFEELLAAEALGALEQQDKATLAVHLASGCPTCDELRSSFGHVAQALPQAVKTFPVPPQIKERILKKISASAVPAVVRTQKWIPWAYAAAAAVILAIVVPTLLKKSTPIGHLANIKGQILINNKAGVEGSSLRSSERLQTFANATADLHLSDKVTVKLMPDSDLEVRPSKQGYELVLNKGGVGNMVQSGTPYVVTASFMKVESKGTVFVVKAESPDRIYVCLCAGHIVLSGNGTQKDLQSSDHQAILVTREPHGLQMTSTAMLYHPK